MSVPETDNEVTILARILGDDRGQLSDEAARYLLGLGFGDRDRARMHDLATRNHEDTLSPAEKDEMMAFARVGTVISILKSKARRALGAKPDTRNAS